MYTPGIATILAVSLGKMVSPLRVAVPCEKLTECRGYCSLFTAVSLEASVVKRVGLVSRQTQEVELLPA